MPSFEAGDVVRVPFPYTNRESTQRRPALVISGGAIGSGMLLWVLMITSTANRPWPKDIAIASPGEATGLPAPSMVRTLKIATIEASAADRIGAISVSELAAVRARLRGILGLG